MRPVPLLPATRGALFLACAAVLAGCRGTPLPEATPSAALAEGPVARERERRAPVAPEPAAPPEDARDAAQTALAAGDIAATRAALDTLVTAPLLETCEAHLRAGRVEEALAAAESALSTSPELPAALFVAGACRAALAERNDDTAEFERALDLLERARGCAGALGTASRIARALGRYDEALELARAGLAPGAAPCSELARVAELVDPQAIDVEAPERALALAALSAWRERREADAAGAARLFEEAEDALQLALARDEGDAWVWRTLGEAYLDAGRFAEASATLENGIDRLSADDELLDLLAKAARRDGGTPAVVRVFERVQAKRPGLGLAWWYPGLERFESAARGAAEPRQLFDESERALRTCRAKDPAQAPRCLHYEALCRTGRGWSWLADGELERAWSEFRAAGEPIDGGLRLEYPPLRSARDGLDALIERYLARGDLDGAARAAERLALDAPGDLRLVRQAADLARDVGDRLHLFERDLKQAGRGDLYDPYRMEELRVEIGTSRPGDDLRGTEREKDMFFELGDRRGRAAREAYLRALAHYKRALELAPDDLRLGCDAAVLVVRRLAVGERAREAAAEVDWAEAQLLRLAQVGEQGLERGTGNEEALRAFEEAFGDVHQLLGELYLEQRKEPRVARGWFEKCLAIAPFPRTEISDSFLPRCLEEERKAAGGRR